MTPPVAERLAPEHVHAAVRAAARRGGVQTNWFGATGPEEVGVRAGETLVVVAEEDALRRVFYFTRDPAELTAALAALPGPALLDVLVRAADGARPAHGVGIPEAAEAAGFRRIATYARMSTDTLTARARAREVRPADPSVAEAAWQMLHERFDARTDHLPSRARVHLLAERGQLFAHGSGDRLDGLILWELEGLRCHWRFWTTRPGVHPAIAVRLLGDFLSDLAKRGINRGYLWVDQANTGPMATYERLGFRSDGVGAHIFERE